MGQRVTRIKPYNANWPKRFAELGRRLRTALGDVALRIDHIGSTAAPGSRPNWTSSVKVSVQLGFPHRPARQGLRAWDLLDRAGQLHLDRSGQVRRHTDAHANGRVLGVRARCCGHNVSLRRTARWRE
jgi:hypothetical protein